MNISLKNKIQYSNTHLKAYVTAPRVTSINASSAATVIVKDPLKHTAVLSFQSSSSGEIDVDVDAPEVVTRASSGSLITIRGKTLLHSSSASSGADIKAGQLLSEKAVVSASSGAEISLHASVNINANASSGAAVTYRGAANVQKNVSSGGSVEKKD